MTGRSATERALGGWRSGPREDFVRFFVLTDSRTGSTWFMDLLRSHPQVVSYDELFHGRAIYGSKESGIATEKPGELTRRERDPSRYLKEVVFSPKEASVGAVGFKVFYRHLYRRSHGFRLPRALAAEPGLRVISLARRDMLSMLVSRELAWGAQAGQESIILSPAHCLGFFLANASQIRLWERYFAVRPLLRVDYEELCRDKDAVMRGVLRHLDCPDMPLSSEIVRSTRRPLSSVVANYGQLRRAFRWTPWRHLFP